jgi:hypothetical protein
MPRRLASRSNISHNASSSGASGSRKRKRDHEEGSSSKKAMTALKRLPAMLQSALYAAERMSHAIWITHAINLVVIGESSRIDMDTFHAHILPLFL